MEQVLSNGEWVSLAISDVNGEPYVVPMNYGYSDGCLYLHGAVEGTKFSILKRNPKVCFCVVTDTELVRNENPSNFSEKYKSVIGKGKAEFLSDTEEKRKALGIFMRHYNGPTKPMPDAMLERVSVVKIKVTELTGKISGYPKDGIEE